MPAPFIDSLCGYRDGRPNTSDKNDPGSIALGKIFFEVMGISPDAIPPDQRDQKTAVGTLMNSLLSADLEESLKADSPHLTVEPEKSFSEFEQFTHLTAARDLRSDMTKEVTKAVKELEAYSASAGLDEAVLTKLMGHLESIRQQVAASEERRIELLNLQGEESLLKLDVTIARKLTNGLDEATPMRHLVAGLSLKWTLRTDRAQDCRSQGVKMAALRRGRMPHFAAVTMEPRPAMLALLGRGSGDIDCVYHLHLPALSDAIDEYCSGSTHKSRLAIRDNFRRLRDQRRIRDYDELRRYIATL
ncbi:NgoMIV family type II restriction endonuclease [Streptomyces niveiscabiei]|uniref:NgoMIV family type II restriction endonuclease n=1 Tax=Streptomyces niveiscabiei TaxID=164115 RepID=UPI0029AF3F36|nr:NgoMIV family type II restriction endonuclease [Streptomyces niveiscabiei]MDX3383595.1 NgoMIV family type II restriction endonuclease [Streptomyces niveiscabiei]